MSEIPDGFTPLAVRSQFPNLLGQFHEKRMPEGRVIGIRAEERHCNAGGVVHGGFLLALADFALSWGSYDPGDTPPRMTLGINAEFAGVARNGDWLEARIDIQKSGSSLVFANCFIWVGAERVLRAGGVFRIVPAERNDFKPATRRGAQA